MEMMFQPPLSSSIHFTITPDQDEEDQLCKQVLGSQKLMMHPIPGKDPVSLTKERNHMEMLPPLTIPRSSSQFSTVSYVCQSPALKYVYQRRKPQKQYEFACTGQASINKESGGLYSAVSSDINLVAAGEEKTVFESQPVNLIFGAPDTPCDVNKIEPLTVISCEMLSSKALQVCGSKEVSERNISLSGLNGTYLSSKSNLEIGADYVNINKNDTGKCSWGLLGMENVDKVVSETDFCISFLRNHGLLGHGNIRTSDVVETISGTSDSRICKKCGHSEEISNLLICDRCDDAFHAWCCQPRVIDIPNEEWFCNSCLKIKKKLLKEMRLLQLQKVNEGTSGNSIVETFDDDLSCFDIMLLDAEPHKCEVRVGKGFQADIPKWSGPIPSEPNFIGETLTIDLSESERLHNSRLHNPSRVNPIGNWLQCREVIRGVRPDIDGAICGKWRRAPLNDVQTDDWDCFSSVLWNPSHADCAAPQELETEEVMKQLKYMQTLKPSLTAMRRKKSQKRSHTRGSALRGQGPSKDAGNP